MEEIIVRIPKQMGALADAVERLVELVKTQATRGESTGPSSYDDFEVKLADCAAAVEREAHGVALGALDIDAPSLTIDGRLHHRVLRCASTYYTMAGEVSVTRTLYRPSGDRETPAIDMVSLRAGVVDDGWLPSTAKAMGYLLQQGTSREAEQLARQVRRLPYSRSSFERVGHAVGQRYAVVRDEVERALIEETDVPDEARSISVSLDRVSVPMEEPLSRPAGRPRKDAPARPVERVFRMAYVGTVSLHDAKGETLHTIRYGTMPGDDAERLCLGMSDDVLVLLSKRPRLRLAQLCDGSVEMWKLLDEQFDAQTFGRKPIRAIIDFWHTLEKLGKAAAVIFGDQATHHLARWRMRLFNSSRARTAILAELRQSNCEEVRVGDERPVHDAITYLENAAGKMDYARALKLGLPIGSGNVEATCKSLVSQRMKRGGARWKIDTGDHVIQLRALALSDRWDAAMALTLAPPKPRIRRVA